MKIKYKNVEKYMITYMKTMNFVIAAKESGKKKKLQEPENEIDTSDTLAGYIEGTSNKPDDTLLGTPPTNNIKDNNIKGNNTNSEKADSKKFKIPLEFEVIAYFLEHSYKEESAKKFFQYYETGNWSDSKGNKVKNWKQKAQSVWFKDENKIVAKKEPKHGDTDDRGRMFYNGSWMVF